ncbi:hypothetical protein CDEST_06539 [Colletotrichum destructivum]|uniref:Uncharacterized protein n=1 Tax=Colletotrichum destructivum TaxID=34406 RepID=A0AAX4IEJ8_9PEZI|nr:hypothetical protein CDEST_06539 [Colletotrichum destructivum]
MKHDVPQDQRKQRLGCQCSWVSLLDLGGYCAGWRAWPGASEACVEKPSKPRRTWTGQRRLISAHHGDQLSAGPFPLATATQHCTGFALYRCQPHLLLLALLPGIARHTRMAARSVSNVRQDQTEASPAQAVRPVTSVRCGD